MLKRGSPLVPPLLSFAGSRSLATNQAKETCLYELLGVPQSADQNAIKEAFRKKAKLLHPDAQSQQGQQGEQAAFVRLLTAYKVLSNARSRELYDLSISAKSSRILRRAAAAGVRGGTIDEEVEIDISWGLGDLFKKAPDAAAEGQSTMLDKLRGELQSDLNMALRHAYLGPKLDLPALQLPDCFEADERSTPEPPEVLELVSGRQLLGVVQERRAAQLGAVAKKGREQLPGAGGLPGARPQDLLPGADPLQAGRVGQAAAGPAAGGAGRPAQRDGCTGQHPAELRRQKHRDEAAAGVAGRDGADGRQGAGTDAGEQGMGMRTCGRSSSSRRASRAPDDLGGAEAAGSPSWRDAAGRVWEGQEGEPEVLELVMGGQLVATAVRHKQGAPPSAASSGGAPEPWHSSGASGSRGHAQGGCCGSSTASVAGGAGAGCARAGGQQAGQGAASEARALVVSFYRGERLLGHMLAEHETATSNSPSAARFLNPQGVHTHTVLRSASPLVRHLSIVAESATGIAPARSSKATVFRARRAWLPPSALWLFKPRNYQFDIGGWYIEWVGHDSCSHSAWLDPAVCVLAAGFDTLDHERAKQQPQGLFGRVRSGDETAGGALRWLKAMLRFHGIRK